MLLLELMIQIVHDDGDAEKTTISRKFSDEKISFSLSDDHLKDVLIDLLSGIGFESNAVRKYLNSKQHE